MCMIADIAFIKKLMSIFSYFCIVVHPVQIDGQAHIKEDFKVEFSVIN